MSTTPPRADSRSVSPNDDHDYLPDNGLRVQGTPTGLEHIYDYEPGGHHPVHIGDMLRQFKVLHKLGHGGYSNVWLCRDTSGERSYVALKILMAEVSTPTCPELRFSKTSRSQARQEASR